MRSKILAALLLFCSTNSFAAIFPTAPSVTVGGVVFTNVSSLIVLECDVSSNTWSTCRKPGLTTGYQVTSGKTYTVQAFVAWQTSGTAANDHIGYGDSDVGVNSTTAPTNFVYAAGGTGVGGYELPAAGNTPLSQPIFFAIPALKYPAMSGLNGHFLLFGYEQ